MGGVTLKPCNSSGTHFLNDQVYRVSGCCAGPTWLQIHHSVWHHCIARAVASSNSPLGINILLSRVFEYIVFSRSHGLFEPTKHIPFPFFTILGEDIWLNHDDVRNIIFEEPDRANGNLRHTISQAQRIQTNSRLSLNVRRFKVYIYNSKFFYEAE